MCTYWNEAPPSENKFEYVKASEKSLDSLFWVCFYLEIKDVMHISLTAELISVWCKFWDFCCGVVLQYQA